MTEFNKFYKDIRFFIPVIVFLIFEILLETGIYTPFLKKNSYAANINRITNHVILKKESHDPDILILGTSVAYQGLSTRILQEKISTTGLKIQSIAIPGSELIVQHLASDKFLKEFPNVKLLIYVGEVTMPWVSQTGLGLPTLAMISEFPRLDVVPLLKEFEYTSKFRIPVLEKEFETHYGISDMSYILFKTIAYRRDMNDFILDPGKRIKYISRDRRNPNNNFYYFENDHTERMSSYGFTSLEDCVNKTRDFNLPPFPENSNLDHKKAILDTCALSIDTINRLAPTKQAPTADTESTRLYFKRLTRVFQNYTNKNINVLTVFAPYSYTMGNIGGPEKMEVWRREISKILGKNNSGFLDLQGLFENDDSNKYCYDTIHLNKEGMEKFSTALGDYLYMEIIEGKVDGKIRK
jgi:hypothetical protein